MSGPIVRKYGFPNHDQIFGKKEIEHGVEGTETPAAPARSDADAKPASETPSKPKRSKK